LDLFGGFLKTKKIGSIGSVSTP